MVGKASWQKIGIKHKAFRSTITINRGCMLVYMARYGIESWRLYPKRGGVQWGCPAAEPVLGPEIARATASAIWAQNRLGLQGNPIELPQVMDYW